MSNKNFFSFNKKNNIIYRFDPRLKLISLIIFLVIPFLPIGMTGLLFITSFLFIGWIVARINYKYLILVFITVVPIFIFVFLINFIVNDFIVDSYLWYTTIYITWRFAVIVIASIIFTITTEPIQIARSIESLLFPLKLFKINTEAIGMMFMISIRYIPVLFEEIVQITESQDARGQSFLNGGFSEKLKVSYSLFIPAFTISFIYADNLTTAMESRGYSLEMKKSRYKIMSIDWKDMIIFSLVLLMMSLSILMAVDTNGDVIPRFIDDAWVF